MEMSERRAGPPVPGRAVRDLFLYAQLAGAAAAVVPLVVAVLLSRMDVVVGGTLFAVPLGLACVFAYATVAPALLALSAVWWTGGSVLRRLEDARPSGHS